MAATERTTKEVVDDARAHLSELVDAHKELAKAELAETQRQLVAGIVPLAIAGILGLFVLGFFGVTAVKGLDNFVTEGWAWLIVSVALTIVLLVLAMVGRNKLQSLQPAPEQTKESVRATLAWAKTKAGKDS